MWKEQAVAVERQHGEAVIVCEGTLAAVLAALQPVRPGRLAGIRVSLPDRRVAPHSFEGVGLQTLLNDPTRPPSVIPADLHFVMPA